MEEMEVELVLEAREVDVDYEFEAPMFFDFTREESVAEALAAERWFDSAPSYPPSPFVARLVWREEEINTSLKSNGVENTATLINDDDGGGGLGLGPELSTIEEDSTECEGMYRGILTNLQTGNLQKMSNQLLQMATGWTFQSHLSTDKSKTKVKSNAKKNLHRNSTLMKPTASLLAKQNQPPQVSGSRFQMLLGQKDRSSCNSSVVESQAAKRQKLEGGHLRKVGDAKQQTDFIHKTPKKDGKGDKFSSHAKLRLTVPREPDLETAHRAQRMRPKNSTELEHVTVAARRFKARPLNRNILEGPSLPLPKKSTPKLPEFREFHLKTSERAMQHTSSVSSSSLLCNDCDKGLDKPSSIFVAENGKRESKRSSTMDASKQEGCTTHVFKARPLNKKMFSSRGAIGVFRNSKRETTVPMEFNFHTEKRIQHNPPTELFSKLSLNGTQLQLPQPSCISIKGSKENRLNPLQTEHKVTHLAKERPPIFGGKQIQCGGNGCISGEVGNQLSIRSLGIR